MPHLTPDSQEPDMESVRSDTLPEEVGSPHSVPFVARVRTAISWGITLGLIILWAFPVAFVGIVSNIHGLCTQYSWLAWLCKLPSPVVGIISGILPPVLLAVLMMLLPIVLRLLARFEGMPKKTAIELSLMHRYFLFEVIVCLLFPCLPCADPSPVKPDNPT